MSEVRRLFVARLPELGGVVQLDEAVARHVRVLRLREGDRVRLFDGSGNEADARILSLDGGVTCEAAMSEAREEEGPRVVLIQCLPKGSKLDSILRMTVEIGVAEVHLAIAGRSVARPDEKRALKRAERLERVAVEAARQARRAVVPPVVPAAELMDVAARAPRSAHRVVVWEGSAAGLDPPAAARDAWVIVGPEGGLATAEIDALEGMGFAVATLGPSILRVETAAPVAVALVLDRLRGRPPV